MQTEDEYEDRPWPIETLEDVAIMLSGYVMQGRIGPTNADDFEAETMLALLSILVRRMEP